MARTIKEDFPTAFTDNRQSFVPYSERDGLARADIRATPAKLELLAQLRDALAEIQRLNCELEAVRYDAWNTEQERDALAAKLGELSQVPPAEGPGPARDAWPPPHAHEIARQLIEAMARTAAATTKVRKPRVRKVKAVPRHSDHVS